MQERGYIHQASDLEALDQAAASGMLTAYVGYDLPRASSLHIGNLIPIMMLRCPQQSGAPADHPDGRRRRPRSATRRARTPRARPLTVEQIEANNHLDQGALPRASSTATRPDRRL